MILLNYSYSVRIIKNQNNQPINLFNYIINIINIILCKNKYENFNVLSNITLFFPSKSTTIVLGSPGCGTTSLLDAIGNRNDNGYIKGKCLYGNKNIQSYNWNRISIICEQIDHHYATLSVEETIKYNKYFQLGTIDFYNNTEVNTIYKKTLPFITDSIIKLLGLNNCKNNLIGDYSIRGISGGEKRRVSLGECILAQHRIILLDKFSTGLDSAITIEIIRMLKEWAIVFFKY